MSLELFAAGAMLSGLVVYALTAGADFGGGILDLLASGVRAADQRKVIERALVPVWEANHVWLIFVVVVMFTAFPPAFARIGTELHIPLTLLLLAIVLRGSAFVFRQYGPAGSQPRWGWVFATSSTVASLFLGVVLGALTTGGDWLSMFSVSVGILAAAAFAFLAATYLAVEVDDDGLRQDFRRRALASGLALSMAAVWCGALSLRAAPRFAEDLFSLPMTPVIVVGAFAMIGAFACLRRRRYRPARVCAATTVALLVAGWAFAHHPLVVAPDLTIFSAAAPRTTLVALVPVLLLGAIVLLPSLWWLMRVFKQQQRR